MSVVTELKKQQILELYFCSDDRRLRVISEITHSSDNYVSNTVQDYFNKELVFERGNYKIYHSKINGYD
jgi:hypothetical protein